MKQIHGFLIPIIPTFIKKINVLDSVTIIGITICTVMVQHNDGAKGYLEGYVTQPSAMDFVWRENLGLGLSFLDT